MRIIDCGVIKLKEGRSYIEALEAQEGEAAMLYHTELSKKPEEWATEAVFEESQVTYKFIVKEI